MLILPKEDQIKAHNDARQGLSNHFNKEMDRVLSENSSKDLY